MSTGIVITFCGDPVATNYWIKMYKKHIEKFIDTIYVYNSYNQEQVLEEEIEFQEDLINGLNGLVYIKGINSLPEVGNNILLREDIKTDNLLLTEADVFIFSSSIVEETLERLKSFNVVAPQYQCFPGELISYHHTNGFMRCLFGVHTKCIKSIDINFLPQQISFNDQMINLDCFAWIAHQLLEKGYSVSYIDNHNMNFNYESFDFQKFPYIHVRQMNSSNIGYGSGRRQLIKEGRQNFTDEMKNEQGIFQIEKAVAFRNLILDIGEPNLDSKYIQDYIECNNKLMRMIGASYSNVDRIYNFFFPLMNGINND